MLHKRVLIILLFFVASLNATPVFSLTLYVSPTGNDNNHGRKESPLASLTGARNKIRELRKKFPGEDVMVIINGGRYFMKEPVVFGTEDGGTGTVKITYMAAPGEHPVFYGGREIKGFEKVTESLWKLYVPEVKQHGLNFEQLYVNGLRAERAQLANKAFYQPKTVTEIIVEKGEGSMVKSAIQKITLFPEQAAVFEKIPPADLEKAVVTFYHKWDNTRKRIDRYSSEDTAFYISGQGMKSWNRIDEKSLFTVENLKPALDAPGEWYLEPSGFLYYVPRKDEPITATTGYAPTLEKFITILGTKTQPVQNLNFENLSFKVAGYQMPPSGNEPMQAAASIEAVIMVDYASNIRFIDCEIAHTGSNAIWIRKSCKGIKIEHCNFHDLGAGGVKIGEIKITAGNENTSNVIVNNNIIRNGGYVFPCAVGVVIFTASDNEVTHNEIANFKYTGVSVGWVWGYGESSSKRNKIDFNHIHHLGWGVLSDMGGVYTLGPSEGTTVSNNVIHHVYATSYGGWGLYTDEGSTGIVMENNLVYSCKSSGFHQHYGKDNIIRNNIFYNQLRSQLEATRVEPHMGFQFTNNIIYYDKGNLSGIRWDKCNFRSDSNAYWNTRTKDIKVGSQTFGEWQRSGKDKSSIIEDPGFADAANLDFQIKNTGLPSKINFRAFDYNRAGVYGDSKWKSLSLFDEQLAREFDALVQASEDKQPHP